MIQLSKHSVAQAFTLLATAAVVFGALPTHSASAQSVNRDHPTPITKRGIEGTLHDRSDFFYAVTAGKGDLTITVDLTPTTGSVAVATFQLYDEQGAELLNPALMPTATSRAGERQTATIHLPTRQRLLLRITDGTGFGGNYRVRLSGAVSFRAVSPRNHHQIKVPSSTTP